MQIDCELDNKLEYANFTGLLINDLIKNQVSGDARK